MKKIILLLSIYFISTVFAYAQSIEAGALQGIDFNDTTIFMNKQEDFFLGWHWSGPAKKVNERLHVNFLHASWGWPDVRQRKFPTIPDTGKPKALVWETWSPVPLSAVAMQFDPVAPTVFDPLHPGREHDATGAVFGFQKLL